MLENETKTIDRRTVVKGAAWSVPAIAAAVAMPMAAASDGVPDTCSGCFKPGTIVGLGAGITASVILNNRGTMAFATGVGIDSNGGDCEFNILTGVAYTGLITSGEMTWKIRDTGEIQTYTSTIALGAQAGVVGTSLGTGVIPFAFTGVEYPNGAYVGSNPPAEPTRLCVNVNFAIKAGVIPIPNAVDISCTEKLCWDMSMQAAGVVATVPFTGPVGAGTVSYLGLDFDPVV